MTIRTVAISVTCDVPGCPGHSPRYGSMDDARRDGWTKDGDRDICPEVGLHAALAAARVTP